MESVDTYGYSSVTGAAKMFLSKGLQLFFNWFWIKVVVVLDWLPTKDREPSPLLFNSYQEEMDSYFCQGLGLI